MGGQSASTPVQGAAPFGQNPGYQQPNQVAPIGQPTVQTPILPTPEQAAAATQARMLARSPMAAPASAPVQKQQEGAMFYRHNGDPVYASQVNPKTRSQ